MNSYAEFLAKKAIIDAPTGIRDPKGINKSLFDFQQEIVKWALRRGRAALFEGTGLGKTPQQCEWARHVSEYTKAPVLIVAPLAVSHQTIAEADKILGLNVTWSESSDAINEPGVYITNYQKLDRFDPSIFGGVALDESSIIKSVDGKTKAKLLDMFLDTPFRLACTATPSPNDYMELGNHAEFLGVMTASEMLSTFFVHDGGETSKWRLKGHAEADFWQWLASWAVCIQSPADIGFDGSAYVLPELRMHEVIVESEGKRLDGELFAMPARTLCERRDARRQTIGDRVTKAAEIINGFNGDSVLTWCQLNTEAEETAKATGSENVTGSDSDERKTTLMLDFARGDLKRLTSKPTLCGFGMNWQVCHRMAFVGLSDSYEQLYQSIRRCYRFGQKHPVDVYIIISSLEGEVLKNIKRKEADALKMQRSLVDHMAGFTKRELGTISRTTIKYNPAIPCKLPSFLK